MAEIKTVNELIERYNRLRNGIIKAREESAGMVERGTAILAGGAGGLASGAVRGMGYQKLPKTDVDTDLALGGFAALGAMFGLGGKFSMSLLTLGIGLSAPSLSRAAETHVRTWNATR